jgi:site-specific recombinase XerC
VDVLSGTIGRSKNGYARRVPMNAAVRSALIEVAAQRQRPDDPAERVFALVYTTINRIFNRAVERAQAALRDAGKDASRLDRYTWHGNRHTFATRLVMAGVDLLSVKELGGCAASAWLSGTRISRPRISRARSSGSSLRHRELWNLPVTCPRLLPP